MSISVKRLIDKCCSISDQVADPTGFVCLRDLATFCKCQIISRPLLVEAAITRRIDNQSAWMALIDREMHPFSDLDYEFESHNSPLPVRTRNTIAHEIAHAVACELLGVDFSEKKNLTEKLKEIENAVETASPFLLLSPQYLFKQFSGTREGAEQMRKLSELAHGMNISREVLLRSIKILSKYNRTKFVAFDGLLGAMWGIIESRGKNAFSVLSQWLFDNYFTASPHIASSLIKAKKRTEWEVVSTEPKSNVVHVSATSPDFDGGESPVVFELGAPLGKSRQKVFFRLPSDGIVP